MPWHPERHHLFPDSFRPVVLTALLVQQRLQRRVQEQEQQEEGGDGGDGGVAVAPPLRYGHDFLTHEIWVLWIVPRLPRFAWATARAGSRGP